MTASKNTEKPQPGEYWKTRDGRVVGPLDISGGTLGYPLTARVDGEHQSWTASGVYLQGEEGPLDLIERVEAPAPASRLEPGWLARDVSEAVDDLRESGGSMLAPELTAPAPAETSGRDECTCSECLDRIADAAPVTAGLIKKANECDGYDCNNPSHMTLIDELSKTLLTLQHERDAAHKAADWNMSVVHDRDKEIAALQKKNKELEADRDALVFRINALEADRQDILTASQAECDSLKEQLANLTKAIEQSETAESRSGCGVVRYDEHMAAIRENERLLAEQTAECEKLKGEVEALRAVEAAARNLPRHTPESGGAFTVHSFQIEASYVWANDAALKGLDAARAALALSTTKEGGR